MSYLTLRSRSAPPSSRFRSVARAFRIGCRTVCLLALLLSPALTLPAAAAPAAPWPAIGLVPVVTALSSPVYVTHAGDGSGRLFVVEQSGRIRVVKNGVLQGTPFLDITAKVSCCGERGLLSVAFPPGYAAKGHFYIFYTDTNGALTVSRYRVTANPDVADTNSEQVLLSVPHPRTNHNSGQMVFGPTDGYLYISMGDGGGVGDPDQNGQNLGALLGKILRIDVESGATPYAIPPSNPFVNNATARHEIWAWGLRNAWRFSFDRQTHDLYIADVGQNAWEEVDFQPASSTGGENYGWNIMEGTHCYQPSQCLSTGLTLPVVEYGHALGCAVTGGYVYRGRMQPVLAGIYFYGDYCEGRIWGLRRAGNAWENTQLRQPAISISTFGEDENGEIYVADYTAGVVYRIVAAALYLPLVRR